MKKKLLGILVILFFSLHLSIFSQDAKIKLTIDNDLPSVELVLLDSNRLYVKNAPIGKKVEVYSIVGTKVKEIEMKSSSGEYLLDLPRSIYIVKLGETVRKFVIR